ncbi:hypothetical protein MPSD_34670 [Mycobacterium pseudoshottsii JCM 15466]|uniref:Uncharacterized protein n=1 Tax=Mycobacterium pseudoshottsii TaxID=265949 RepID=A0A9N7QPK5_9MYCO|nr:hypothetical protein MPSD_34670 [Mycobacterium pseudoshottsii JCM 15466]BDN83185.1 hypothetical protein NJB1907Z4_C34000 [Mycobacterium pseudoshottsii]
MALSLSQARSVYDRIGRIQDWQAFYEDETLDRLVANAALATGPRTGCCPRLCSTCSMRRMRGRCWTTCDES